ncbi:ABC transporter permease [Phaeobacter sp.]|uniref:ABC transporter permease n=1 Tax=Phaeobacter sp. TaxID=1902409 RepID=UPI0025E8B5EE|nr:ABC transporter permease [Phaeobacter sp.]
MTAGNRTLWLLIPAVLLIGVCFLYPVSWLLQRSVSEPVWGLQNYATIFSRSIYLGVLWNTITIAGVTTVLCALIGFPVAYSMVHARPRIRKLLIFVVLIPFWTSILVRSFAWLVILQRGGIINDILTGIGLIAEPMDLVYNRFGVLLGMVQVLLPFMVFPLYAVMARIDGSFFRAATNLGATPVRAFFRVYLPLCLPGLGTGAMLVFIVALGYFITPALLGGRGDIMIAQLIFERIDEFGDWPLASALAIVLLVGTGLLFAIIKGVSKLRRGRI